MKHLLLATAILALGACASSPAYGPAASAVAPGYSEQMIETNRWRVKYTGSPTTASTAVQDYALMRAAELTLEKGGAWFEVVTSTTDRNDKQRSSIETDYGPDYAVRRTCGLVGCTTEAVPVMTRTRKERVETRTIYEHAMEIVIGAGGSPASGSPNVYNARDTFDTLKDRLG